MAQVALRFEYLPISVVGTLERRGSFYFVSHAADKGRVQVVAHIFDGGLPLFDPRADRQRYVRSRLFEQRNGQGRIAQEHFGLCHGAPGNPPGGHENLGIDFSSKVVDGMDQCVGTFDRIWWHPGHWVTLSNGRNAGSFPQVAV
jgi:hypothetical protein